MKSFLAYPLLITMSAVISLSHIESKAEEKSSSPTSLTLSEKLPSGLISAAVEGLSSKYNFVVDKSARTLSIYEATTNSFTKIAEYPTDIGKGVGDKQKTNDKRTPVGIYFLQKELTQPEIPFDTYGSLAFTMDYPNIFDKRAEKTGWGIWLHAVPDTVPLTRGSRGCVVVRNDVIKSLKSFVKLEQTPVIIYDQVELLDKETHQKNQLKFLKHFEDWRLAWQNQDVDSYINYYDETFKNSEMNYKQWYRHKKKLKELYSYIKVELSQPMILINKDQVVIRTLQKYESNLHKDYGQKTIHARLDEKVGFRIIREDWKELPDPSLPQAQPAGAPGTQEREPSNTEATP